MASWTTLSYNINGGTSAAPSSSSGLSATKTISSTIPTNNKEANKATTQGDHFTVIFNDNNVNSSGTITKTTVTVTGYEFAGWKDLKTGLIYQQGDSISMGGKDIELYAQWKEIPKERVTAPEITLNATREYYDRTVIFNADANEAFCEIASITDEVTLSHSQKGWHKTANSTSTTPTVVSGGKYYPTENITLYAIKTTDKSVKEITIPKAIKKSNHFARQVNFNGNGGSIPYSSALSLADIKYTFIGWNNTLKSDYDYVYTWAQYLPGEQEQFFNDVTLYPSFFYQTDSVYSLRLPGQEECFKPGHSLLGWSTNPSAIVETYEPGQVIQIDSENMTLYAIWGSNTITVNYWATDASEGYYQNLPIRDFTVPVFSKTYGLNETVTIPEADNENLLKIDKTGYNPMNIWRSFDQSLTFNSGEQISAKDLAVQFNKDININNIIIDLYIKWTTEEYTLTMDTQIRIGDPETKSIRFNSRYAYDPDYGYDRWFYPTIANQSFAGWWYTEDGAGDINTLYDGQFIEPNTIVKVPKSHTIYAAWYLKQHYITINPEGGTWNSSVQSQTINSDYLSIQTLPPPTKSNCIFTGWVQKPYYTLGGTQPKVLRTEGSRINNSLIKNSLFIDANDLPQPWNDAILTRIEDDSLDFPYAIQIISHYNNVLDNFGGFCSLYQPLDDSSKEVTYIHAFLAKVPKGESLEYKSNLLHNPKVRFSWLTNPHGKDEWILYAYQVICEPGFSKFEGSSFGAVGLQKQNNTTSIEWRIGSNQITKNPNENQEIECGPVYDELYAQWILIPSIYRYTKTTNYQTNNSYAWKKGIPYVYIDGVWRQAVPYVYDGEKWQLNS